MESSGGGKREEEDVGSYNSNNVKKARLHSTLTALLDDPILADVPKEPTLSDVDTLINLELGSAMRISVIKLDSTSFDVAVLNSATVKDLKLAIKKKINDMEQSKMGHRHISWKHVWANFCLSYYNDKLINDGSALQDFGIHNNSQVLALFFLGFVKFILDCIGSSTCLQFSDFEALLFLLEGMTQFEQGLF
ncbi:U11/U12 small nuclear ribonucleoprotein 25 kDa protein isoform X1 [Vitis vinifera]|uniref:U11/U12 small nuclear ribonucleoprotein 25 kDa protein isoform X1 n=1 Tax=Vitis vinifera TaxID=29760 RepID=UPI0028832B67|nr:U11/U12 small nuclear ribonucleoprotein 25 kDa protein isoform X1 [Vitis vinifera]